MNAVEMLNLVVKRLPRAPFEFMCSLDWALSDGQIGEVDGESEADEPTD